MEEPIQETEVVESGNHPVRRTWVLWLGLGGVLVLLCAAVFVVTLIFAGPRFIEKYLPDSILPASELTREITSNNTMGDPNAPVHIVEYVDFQCPFCLRFWQETEPQLIDEYVNTGQVYFEVRSYAFLGPESQWAAEVAYCAGDQGGFWEFHDTLFANWTGENVGDFTHEKLNQYADSIGLEMNEFEACLTEEKHRETVEQDRLEAEADGVHATPTFIINGIKVEGAQPFDALKHIIEEMLNGGPNSVNG
jgi:predicted DsbA family dithiol-disulfide isomerase